MERDTQALFLRVSEKLGWIGSGGLDTAEKKLQNSIKKSRRLAVECTSSWEEESPKSQLSNSSCPGKENQEAKGNGASNRAWMDSSDEDFDQFLFEKVTPKPTSKQPRSTTKKVSEPVHILSSDSDGSYETFLNSVRKPKAQARKISLSGSEDSLKHFIVNSLSSDDDFVLEKKPITSKGKSKATPKTPQVPKSVDRQPLSQWESPVFLSDSDDDSALVIKSTWRTRHSNPESLPKSPLPSSRAPPPSSVPVKTCNTKPDPCSSSDDEFQSLLDRVKKNSRLHSSISHSPKPQLESKQSPLLPDPPVRGQKKSEAKQSEKSLKDKTPLQPRMVQPAGQTSSATNNSRVAVCKTPRCFLQSLSEPTSAHSRTFKQKKEQLTSELYQLYNSSVFEGKLPSDMSVTWNKRLRRTAGWCITGKTRGTGDRYARIELSVKVCDSADRLRDTLVHEMCHAATWLINNVRDGHGPFWKLYAHKAMLAHPELPMISRCHSYDINYKYQYQCTRCKNTIGRHSKSLDTERFGCGLCTGKLILLNSSTPRAPTPFASFVKENYGNVRQELQGQSHAEVMRKLSEDFSSKTRLSQS
ncbi:germ cell nuclear acidic protein [Denticeps clupeoides]|uniref:germ cell nuclear acidic protein n=1 Tax=Denticeps clupeoides TaxID=299321 RepID=UPI0010A4CEC7|nr:acidic repeat-containing protein-like [Denticeps clupeoides]